MAHVIERAKSGRAKCRKCREKIEKDVFRFGHEVESQFGDEGFATQWYHLECAAQKVPIDLEKTLQGFAEELPDREKLVAEIAKNRAKQKPTTMPYAEVAPSGRSGCLVCEEKIPKGEIRIAVEREIDAGGFARMGAGYLHPQCAMSYEEIPEDLAQQIEENSISLADDELSDVIEQLEG